MEILIENKFLTGAVEDEKDDRDIKWDEVASANNIASFDWNKGYDIEEELSKVLNISNFKIPIKNQGSSGSCGGQAWSTYIAVLEAFFDGSFEERSAKFIYSQTFVQGGGSAGRENSNVVIKQGCARESICPSYENGLPPSEAFMERVQDISLSARQDAKTAKALNYANVAPNIDQFAQAIEINHGIVMGVSGENNGTWLSVFPQPPKNRVWGHWIYAGKARMINGKKEIGILNSWGEEVGENGWQWIGEEYFNAFMVWASWTLIFDKTIPKTFKHTFSQSLLYGQRNQEIKYLQQALKIDGEFSGNITGYYGKLTQQAVRAFQDKYNVADPAELAQVDGKRVGPKTITKLNELFS